MWVISEACESHASVSVEGEEAHNSHGDIMPITGQRPRMALRVGQTGQPDRLIRVTDRVAFRLDLDTNASGSRWDAAEWLCCDQMRRCTTHDARTSLSCCTSGSIRIGIAHPDNLMCLLYMDLQMIFYEYYLPQKFYRLKNVTARIYKCKRFISCDFRQWIFF